ncbi:MAG: hypothetical protein ACR2PX_06565 [Endozoicomonas sp.]|uniref:hypothetical protein n=1 Tax=Endozoicomonas sp. TaxID=1892382 RepID=UPI003D9AF60F
MFNCITKRTSKPLLVSLLSFYLLLYSHQTWAPLNRFSNLRTPFTYLLASVHRSAPNQPLAWIVTNQVIHPTAPAPANNILSHHISPLPQGSGLPLNDGPHLDDNTWHQIPLGSIHTPLQGSGALQFAEYQIEIDTSTPDNPNNPVIQGIVQALGQLDLQLIQQTPWLCSIESQEVSITQGPQQPASHSYFDLLQQVRAWLSQTKRAASQLDSAGMSGGLPLIRPGSAHPTPFIIRNSRMECPSLGGSYLRLPGCQHNIANLQFSFVSPPAMAPPEITGIHNEISGITTVNAIPAPGGSWWCNFMQVTSGGEHHYVVVGSAGNETTYALVPISVAIHPFRWILNPGSCAQQAGKSKNRGPDNHPPPPPPGVM